mmetsp:Transcript_14590/g.30255  ORF Transcript_14590/g.30255 Transcript_14590/m.30255 type:complete len:213 (-) Transcript_14590:130-768(-)
MGSVDRTFYSGIVVASRNDKPRMNHRTVTTACYKGRKLPINPLDTAKTLWSTETQKEKINRLGGPFFGAIYFPSFHCQTPSFLSPFTGCDWPSIGVATPPMVRGGINMVGRPPWFPKEFLLGSFWSTTTPGDADAVGIASGLSCGGFGSSLLLSSPPRPLSCLSLLLLLLLPSVVAGTAAAALGDSSITPPRFSTIEDNETVDRMVCCRPCP